MRCRGDHPARSANTSRVARHPEGLRRDGTRGIRRRVDPSSPGETKTVRFTLGPSDLVLLDSGLRWTVEPGAFEVAVGSSSRAIQLKGRFEVLP